MVALAVLWALAPLVHAQPGPELSAPTLVRALELTDAWSWVEAEAHLAALLDRDPGSIEAWLAYHDLVGRGTHGTAFFGDEADRALAAEVARRGAAVPPRVRAWLGSLIAGTDIPLERAAERPTGTPWDAYLEIRRRLLEPAFDALVLDAMAHAAVAVAGDGPFAFYLADRLAHLEVALVLDGRTDRRGLSGPVRTALRRRAYELERLERYRLPHLPPRATAWVDGALAPFDLLDRSVLESVARQGTSYADDARFYLAVMDLRDAGALDRERARRAGPSAASRRAEAALVAATRDRSSNVQLAALELLYTYIQSRLPRLAHADRWRRLLELATEVQQALLARSDLARLGRGTRYAFNDPESTDFLLGYCHSQLGDYDTAIALYDRALARARAHGDWEVVPANIFGELSLFHRARGQWGPAFAHYDEYARREKRVSKGDWFLFFLLAAPAFVACSLASALHVFLSMLLAGVFLFSRATANRRHFRYAAALAALYAVGMGYLLAELDQPVDQALSLALGAGALVFMPAATGRSHWPPLGAGSRRVWVEAAWVVGAIALMAGWTAWMVREAPFRPHPFWRFLKELPMMAPVAQALSIESGAALSRGLLLVVLAALQEEVLYRGFTLPVLARYLFTRDGRATPFSWAMAQALTALAWAAAHAGMTEPQSWKLVHVVGLSLVLGALFRRRGLLACIAAHALFNVGALLYPLAFG